MLFVVICNIGCMISLNNIFMKLWKKIYFLFQSVLQYVQLDHLQPITHLQYATKNTFHWNKTNALSQNYVRYMISKYFNFYVCLQSYYKFNVQWILIVVPLLVSLWYLGQWIVPKLIKPTSSMNSQIKLSKY